MKIADKYSHTTKEKRKLKKLATQTNAEDAFINLCCVLIIRGYYRAIKQERLKQLKDEEDLSDFLAEQIECCCQEGGHPYHIDTDSRDRSQTVDGNLIKGKKRKRYDIKFSTFHTPFNEYAFGLEAKLLIENDVPPKESKTLIDAYISKSGMKKFIDGIYSKKGCMIGYITEGIPTSIISKINIRIKRDTYFTNKSILRKKKPIENYKLHYESIHENLKYPLKHLLLDFVV